MVETSKAVYIASRQSGERSDWLKQDAAARLPATNQDFNQAHFPQDRAEAIKLRGSSMVENDRPEPVLKPSPSLASESDRQSFNTRWETEHQRAAHALKQERQGLANVKDSFVRLSDQLEGMDPRSDERAMLQSQRQAYMLRRQAQTVSTRSEQEQLPEKQPMRTHQQKGTMI